MNRSRWALVASFAAMVAVAGCDLHDKLLEPQNPGLIDPSAVASPTAALALRVGALSRYQQIMAGEGTWQMGGTLTDEFKNSDFLTPRIDVDQRTMDNQQNWNYTGLTQSRGFVRTAIDAMQKYVPDSTALIGELWAELGFLELTLADHYCNGIPLGSTVNGVFINGVPLTTQQVYDSVIAHNDSALSYSTGSDVSSVAVRRAAQIYKARALVMKGQFAAAAALVTTANVPSTYQYNLAFSPNSGSNPMWLLANSVARITVGDSFDFVGGAKNLIVNALPFASANDPRLPVQVGGVPPEDGVTPMFLSLLWKNQYDPWTVASGIDARLIEAEAALNNGANGDIPGMMAILNALRAAPPKITNTTIAPMAALPTPATKAAAVKLFFREKAFWTFGRGERLPDMRRMIRLYGLPQDQVFPTGVFFKGGNYGTDVNLPVPNPNEQVNPLFSGCLDRSA